MGKFSALWIIDTTVLNKYLSTLYVKNAIINCRQQTNAGSVFYNLQCKIHIFSCCWAQFSVIFRCFIASPISASIYMNFYFHFHFYVSTCYNQRKKLTKKQKRVYTDAWPVKCICGPKKERIDALHWRNVCTLGWANLKGTKKINLACSKFGILWSF